MWKTVFCFVSDYQLELFPYLLNVEEKQYILFENTSNIMLKKIYPMFQLF